MRSMCRLSRLAVSPMRAASQQHSCSVPARHRSVQVFWRSPEAKIPPDWADALVRTAPEDTLVSRVFSGRPGRSIATAYARAATAPEAPAPAPYPIQRRLTAGMRGLGTKEDNIDRIQAWAGQSAALAAAESASAIVERSWTGAQALLGLS